MDYLEDPTFPILPKAGLAHSDAMPISSNGIGMQALTIASCEKTSMDGSDIAATSVRVLWLGDGRSMVGSRTSVQRIVALRCRRFLQGRERRLLTSARGTVARHTSLTNGESKLFGSCAARSKLQDEYLVKKLSPHFHFALLISLLRPNPKEMWSYNV